MSHQRAAASVRPCQLLSHHAPRPSRTQSHHRFPEYLQRRLWGAVRIQDRLDLCGTCHDNVHEWLGFLLGESRRPSPEPGRAAKAEAERAYRQYLASRS